MKKNLLQIISILFLFPLLTISCSDDENENSGNANTELYVDDIKKNTSLEIYTVPIQYSTTNNSHSLSIIISFIENGNQSNPYGLMMSFKGYKLENMNVGDDLTQITTYSYLLLSYNGNNYGLSKSDATKNEFKGYQGQVIIKELNLDKMIMKVELSGIILPKYKNSITNPTNEETLKIRGYIKDEILIQ